MRGRSDTEMAALAPPLALPRQNIILRCGNFKVTFWINLVPVSTVISVHSFVRLLTCIGVVATGCVSIKFVTGGSYENLSIISKFI